MPTRILLVEDQLAHAKLIQRSFERTGATLVVVRTLARGYLATMHPELVIVDLVLVDGRMGLSRIAYPEDRARVTA